MSVVVMRVSSKKSHPNADSLFVYLMDDPYRRYQIVANSENQYEVGDHAIVATSGSHLKSGLTISKEEVRGVVSQGMALGKASEGVKVGTDLTSEYCLSVYHIAWPSIESIYNVRKKSVAKGQIITYGAKIKLDGTCAAVQILPDRTILAQSRTQFITPNQDNAGFASWVEQNKRVFEEINRPMVIHGEWCGAGIQKRCSISKIGRKVFCVFAMQFGDYLETSPEIIKGLLPNHEDIFVIPWYKFVDIDYGNDEILQKTVDRINLDIAEIEKCDPFVKDTFGVDGLGEGLVFYPVLDRSNTSHFTTVDYYTDFVFKVKGNEHQVVKTKAPAQINPEVANSVDEFVTLFVTENRLNQFAEKFPLDMKETGNFLKAFLADVQKESSAELEASNLTWKDVNSALSTKARSWWQNKVNRI